jgi:hypothetical protein
VSLLRFLDLLTDLNTDLTVLQDCDKEKYMHSRKKETRDAREEMTPYVEGSVKQRNATKSSFRPQLPLRSYGSGCSVKKQCASAKTGNIIRTPQETPPPS